MQCYKFHHHKEARTEAKAQLPFILSLTLVVFPMNYAMALNEPFVQKTEMPMWNTHRRTHTHKL